jgi:hypothetical protein
MVKEIVVLDTAWLRRSRAVTKGLTEESIFRGNLYIIVVEVFAAVMEKSAEWHNWHTSCRRVVQDLVNGPSTHVCSPRLLSDCLKELNRLAVSWTAKTSAFLLSLDAQRS